MTGFAYVAAKGSPCLGGSDALWAAAQTAAVCHYHANSSEHHPTVEARAMHDDEALYLRFDVQDRFVRGRTTESNGPVYTDSCVEFFVSVHDNLYTNFEINCLGEWLHRHRTSC
jgi:hypothetical protein